MMPVQGQLPPGVKIKSPVMESQYMPIGGLALGLVEDLPVGPLYTGTGSVGVKGELYEARLPCERYEPASENDSESRSVLSKAPLLN